jgi:Leucine-rich repeat (LRR) protein
VYVCSAANWHKLVKFYCNNNQLEQLPEGIGQGWQVIEKLYLNHNNFSEFPIEVGVACVCHVVSSETHPYNPCAQICSLGETLDELFLNDNQLPNIPPEIGNLKNLNKLYLIGKPPQHMHCKQLSFF